MNIDLNLLRILDVMLEENSVTRTGLRLGLTQSAVSHALNRLRYMLDDDLFVRGPHGMQPTSRAAEMGPQVHAALSQLSAALAPSSFNPATSDRRFTIMAGVFVSAVLAPSLVNRMAKASPQVDLVLADLAADVVDRLDARRADFAVGAVISAPDRFAYETLVTETLAWVVRTGNPLLERNIIDLEALVSVPHIVISRSPSDPPADAEGRRTVVSRATWEDTGRFEALLGDAGLTRHVGVTVPDAYAALAIASRTDMATLIPRRLAQRSAQSGLLKLIEPPYESPPVDVTLLYLRERTADPAIAWMLEMIREVAVTV